MRKLTFASIASIVMVPALFCSKDSLAISAFARKYGTSCYTCHAGFATRNSFGEAFKANGYRWPGGEDADHAKQEQVKLGADGWKKTFPESPWPSDLPGFAPVAFFVTGPLVNYSQEATATKAVPASGSTKAVKVGDQMAQQTLNWGGPFDARILYGGTIGDNIGFFGALQGFAASGTNITSQFRATWSFSPGVMLGVGNNFSFWSSGEDIATFTGVYPSTTGTGVEFSYAAGEKSGGVNIYAGTVGNGATAAQLTVTTPGSTKTHLDDIRYLRTEYKIGGAGVLSGAGGTYGNEYVGLDNSVELGASIVNAKPGIFTNTFANNKTVYGVDITGSYGSFFGGAAYSRDSDTKFNNYGVDAGYFFYPWLQGKVAYRNLGDVTTAAGDDKTNPTVTTTVTAWPRANVSVAAAYKRFTHDTNTTVADLRNNVNTFTLTTAFCF